ncbi:hypothetical protein B0T19DRAFT_108904 [Cercophora scortea]|uniref:Ribonuclease H1 N-terminal domain-containing protein n=1 Tax=Cercophora scortea TaxID=314031 RepID=A0AAE0MHG9_9PEZI|nr:hypothetical protein B0T19DRAFT_108904 [Cercophora scortea]
MVAAKKRKSSSDEKKMYAVKVGRNPGIYETWAECQAQTTGYPGAACSSSCPLPHIPSLSIRPLTPADAALGSNRQGIHIVYRGVQLRKGHRGRLGQVLRRRRRPRAGHLQQLERGREADQGMDRAQVQEVRHTAGS